jgi:hypothetical protein
MSTSLEAAFRTLLREVLLEVAREVFPAVLDFQSSAVDRRSDGSPSTGPFQLLRRKEAAQALGISERKLFALTKAGKIDCVKIDRSVRYDPTVLQSWIKRSNGDRTTVRSTSASGPLVASKKQRPTDARRGLPDKRGGVKSERPDSSQSGYAAARPAATRQTQAAVEKVGATIRSRDVKGMLAIALNVPATSIPPLTNGEIMRAMELTMAECHGWQYLGRELPDGAFVKLVEHIRNRLRDVDADLR